MSVAYPHHAPPQIIMKATLNEEKKKSTFASFCTFLKNFLKKFRILIDNRKT